RIDLDAARCRRSGRTARRPRSNAGSISSELRRPRTSSRSGQSATNGGGLVRSDAARAEFIVLRTSCFHRHGIALGPDSCRRDGLRRKTLAQAEEISKRLVKKTAVPAAKEPNSREHFLVPAFPNHVRHGPVVEARSGNGAALRLSLRLIVH